MQVKKTKTDIVQSVHVENKSYYDKRQTSDPSSAEPASAGADTDATAGGATGSVCEMP